MVRGPALNRLEAIEAYLGVSLKAALRSPERHGLNQGGDIQGGVAAAEDLHVQLGTADGFGIAPGHRSHELAGPVAEGHSRDGSWGDGSRGVGRPEDGRQQDQTEGEGNPPQQAA